MSMDGYLNYLKNIVITPNESYRNDAQALLESEWENTTLLGTVQEEIEFGKFEFAPIEVWKNTITEFNINTVKDERNYRRLLFKDISHKVDRGLFYQFDDNYWIVYNPTNIENILSDVCVLKCNNSLKWIDRESGEIYEIPCFIDYEVGSPSPQVSQNITTPNAHIVLYVQGNEKTKKIKKNQRFIFNGEPYKFVSYNIQMQENYITKKVPIYFMDLYLDQIHEGKDDLVNNIADRYEIDYSINILQDNFEQIKGFKGQLTAEVKLNGDIVDRDINWKVMNENVVVDNDGNYELIGEPNTEAIIRAYIKGNNEIYDEILVKIQELIVNRNEIIIEPLHEEISQNEQIVFTVYVYDNGIKKEDKINVTKSGLDDSYYTLNVVGHTLVLTSKKISKTPLTLTFTSRELTKSIDIKFKSAF